MNRSSFVSANTPSKICHTFPGNGRCQRLSFKTKAAGSVEGNVLDKESASISDKIERGDPLTAEELEEKERLLEEEHATAALQYFLGIRSKTALHSLLHWICSYQILFTKVCKYGLLSLSFFFSFSNNSP
ncbi:hypothetical protein F383_32120 [Gossypium arboreum]|uniref:Uncharacterized protein n=1 Tax=Gossypium arboreum TaxID=29729 RepID=A0A0B0PRJ6_GOSAR|nr:hypothetical protein F383_32120 [Gossypium arboreum]